MKDNFFYGLEGNKLFKIYADEMTLHGAKIGTNVYDEKTARAIYGQFGLIGFFMARSAAKKTVAKRLEQETKYDALAPGSPPFREGDKANFSLSSGDVLSALVKPKATGIKGAFSGGASIEFSLSNGKKRRFLLIEDQNVQFVKNLVSRVVPNTQLNA
ncbi:hypothetical protein B1R32_11919 [Abditibacterium utsteinense]|uniref:Uncharacterized protein n=1 Tax=Abditibacterium utsteinense TaxID=1960156 RepID=A0A2S8SQ38_9BACT|nr:hypothetical protein [Abditibacterium utsteinense]PQV62879.1 hypothetical protein B1R32_11919 [Abditibacterium utsteinense]